MWILYGDNLDDKITFSKIDHGMMPSDLQALKRWLLRVVPFQALCVNDLKRVSTHTFTSADIVLNWKFSPDEWMAYLWFKREFWDHETELNKVIVKEKMLGDLPVSERVYDDEHIESKIGIWIKKK